MDLGDRLVSKEQRLARDVLKNLALIDECRMGVPPRVHFRLPLEQLGNRLSDRTAGVPHSVNWQDTAMVAKLLGPSVAYHRTLADIGGGVHAGLMLSRALYRTRLQTTRKHDAWISNSAARWCEEIGLSRREHETARHDLGAYRRLGRSAAGHAIPIGRAHQSRSSAIAVDRRCAGGYAGPLLHCATSLWGGHRQVCTKGRNKHVGIPHTNFALSAITDWPFPPSHYIYKEYK